MNFESPGKRVASEENGSICLLEFAIRVLLEFQRFVQPGFESGNSQFSRRSTPISANLMDEVVVHCPKNAY